MKKILLFVFIFSINASLLGFTDEKANTKLKEESQQTYEINEKAIENLVYSFGGKLQMVSLQAPKDILSKSIEENYGDFVSPALLEKWQRDPKKAPGRMLSSPWPDSIEILAIKKLREDIYEVKGQIIYLTSVEKVKGGAAAKQPINLIIVKIGNGWVIHSVTLGDYE